MSTDEPNEPPTDNTKKRLARTQRLADARRQPNPWAGRFQETLLARELIFASRLADERDLADRCFLEYRYLTPYQRTERFVAEFERQWDKCVQFVEGSSSGRHLGRSLSMLSNREFNAVWRARQVADALGIPYGLFIRSGMEWMLQESGKKRIPRFNQLWDPRQIERIREYWTNREPTWTYLGEDWDPRFDATNHRDDLDPVQQSSMQLIEKRVRGQALNLANFLRGSRSISEAEARRRFPRELVDEALVMSWYRDPRPPVPQVTDLYVPNCFGFAHDQDAPDCLACPARSQCAGITDKANSRLVGEFGSVDPRRARKLEQNRLSQQKSRAKKRGKDAAGMQEPEPTPD